MYSKPRIFISSLLKGKLTVRDRIEELFKSVGAEPMLYEKNLTPSVDIYTYRKDILDADFVIFILDEKYGNKTESGISGTEEEYNLAVENKIKSHVYIKKNEDDFDEDEKEFINRIKTAGVSYYLYQDENNLVKRISETIMEISRVITINGLSSDDLPYRDCRRIAMEHDYKRALDISAIIDRVLSFANNYDHLQYDLMISLDTALYYYDLQREGRFIDSQYERLLNSAMVVAKDYIANFQFDFCCGTEMHKMEVPVAKEITFSRAIRTWDFNPDKVEWYNTKWNQFSTEYSNFVAYAQEQRLLYDKLVLNK